MVNFDQPHQPLINFRVLYIGRAAPKATLNSVEAIQKPLFELYTKDDRQSKETDVDAVLTIFTSGLLMAPVNPLDQDIWLPIQSLQSCAAVKAVVGKSFQGCLEDSQLSFVPVDSMETSKSPYPPIFTVTMGRSNGLPLTDCYAFICQSSESALMAVQATMQAFGNERGWAEDRPKKRGLVATQCSQPEVTMEQTSEYSTPPEFYERPPLKGFFYAPSPSLIQKYHIHGLGNSGPEQSPYIPERPIQVVQPPPVTTYDRQWDRVLVEEDFPDGFRAVDRAYVPPPARPARGGGSINGGAVAFNPYLIPATDIPPGAPQPRAFTVDAMRPMRNEEETVIVPVAEETVIVPVAKNTLRNAPGYGLEQQPVYQKRPTRRSELELYANHGDAGIATVPVAASPSLVGVSRRSGPAYQMAPIVEQPAEDLYAHRLPPPGPEPLPSGARQFDSNFILQQSDTDKARIAEIRSYPSPQLGIADFGF